MLKDMYKNSGYEYLTNLLLGVSLAFLVCYQYNFKVSPSALLLCMAVTFFIMFLGLKNYQKPITYVAGIAIVMISSTLLLQKIAVYDYVQWIKELMDGNISDDKLYVMVTIVLGTIIISIPMYFLLKLQTVKRLIGVMLIVYIGYMCYYEMNIDKMCIICMIMYIFINVIELVCEKSGMAREKVRGIMTNLIPAVLVVFAVFMLMTYPKGRYEWKTVKRIYSFFDKLANEFVAMLNEEEKEEDYSSNFNVSFIGYSGEGNVDGGTLSESMNRVALLLYCKKDETTPIYLKGDVSNYFDGKNWSATNNNFNVYYEYELDALEYIYALYRAEKFDKLKEYVAHESIIIAYGGIDTNAVFIPTHTLAVDLSNAGSHNLDYNVPTLLGYSNNAKFYNVDYLKISKQNIDEIIELNEDYTYNPDRTELYAHNKFSKILETVKLGLTGVNLEEVYANRAKEIYEEYMDISSVTPNVQKLAKEITKNCTTDYEKIKALSRYLNTFTYTLTPEECPADKDFMEFFLTESKEGYCTYFATAMTLMARSVGIPARYVEGFAARPDNFANTLQFGAYKYRASVTNIQSHAWTEVYIEGVGFITVEATPSYENIMNGEWETEEPEAPEDLENSEAITEIENTIKESYKHSTEEDVAKVMSVLIKVLALILVTFLLALMAYILFCVIKQRRRYKKADNTQKMYIDLELIIRLTSEMGIVMQTNDTIKEYMTKLSKYYEELTYSLDKISKVYNSARWGEVPVTDEELMHFAKVREFIKLQTKENVGVRKYILNVYCKN